MTETIEIMVTQIDQQQLATELVEQARANGIELIGEDGLPTGPERSARKGLLDDLPLVH